MMKNLYSLLLLAVLAGCGTHAIYGVPEEQWNQMNEPERQATIERFKQQQQINAQTRTQAEKAKKEAEEFTEQCFETDEDENNSSDSTECEVKTRRKWLFW